PRAYRTRAVRGADRRQATRPGLAPRRELRVQPAVGSAVRPVLGEVATGCFGFDGPAWIRTRLLIAVFSSPWVHRWGHAANAYGRVWIRLTRLIALAHARRRRLARSGRQRNLEIGTDLPSEPEVDLSVTRDRRRALGVEAPEAVVPALGEQARAVVSEMALEIATLHAPMTSSSGSLSAPSVTSGCPPKRSSRMPRSASITFVRASSRVRPWL